MSPPSQLLVCGAICLALAHWVRWAWVPAVLFGLAFIAWHVVAAAVDDNDLDD